MGACLCLLRVCFFFVEGTKETKGGTNKKGLSVRFLLFKPYLPLFCAYSIEMIYYTTCTLYVQIKAVSVRNRAHLAIVAYLPKQLNQIVNTWAVCRGVVGVCVCPAWRLCSFLAFFGVFSLGKV